MNEARNKETWSEKAPVSRKITTSGWWKTAILSLAMLALAFGLSIPGWAITGAVGISMTFAGPVYAAFYVPGVIIKWRSTAIDDYDLIQRNAIMSFGSLNQKMTMILSAVLICNLIAAAIMRGIEQSGSLIIIVGIIAVCAGIPIFILNLIWILRPIGIASENIAVRGHAGAWKLIVANRILSMIVWCGYPIAAIVAIVIGNTPAGS